MNRSTDIEFAIAAILKSAQKKLHLISDLDGEREHIRVQGESILIRAKSIGKHHIECTESIIIDASIDGGIGSSGRIEAASEAIITGDAYNQHITAHTIRIGGKAVDCRLESLGDTVVQGDLIESHVVLGALGIFRSELQQWEGQIRRLVEQHELIGRQIARDANNLRKICDSASFNLNLAAGRLIQHEAKGLKIDLTFFYEQVKEKSDDEVRLALNEFFNRGIVGVIGRANRSYFASSPANERLFTKVLSSLRQLVFSVYERDGMERNIVRDRDAFDEYLARYKRPDRHLQARGKISPASKVDFLFPHLEINEEGYATVATSTVRLSILSDEQGTVLRQKSPNGSEHTTRTRGELKAVRIGLQGDDATATVRTVPLRE